MSMHLRDVASVMLGSSVDEMQPGDIVVRRVGNRKTVGKPVMIVEQDASSYEGDRQNVFVVRVERTDILLPRYLFYVLQYWWQQGIFCRMAAGTAQQRLPKNALTELSIERG